MTAFYNEIDPYAAEWLRNLIAAGHIAAGVVDERSISDIRPSEIASYTQCHFFAGIGGWSLALRLAGWSDARPVWTGSCPCQPFSQAGKRTGYNDARHLWPAWWRLIRECRPAIVLGEQVANARAWLDDCRADLESVGYAFGASVLPACGVGAPHRRERLWFVAHADGERQPWRPQSDERPIESGQQTPQRDNPLRRGAAVADAKGERCEPRPRIANPMGAGQPQAVEPERRAALFPAAERPADFWTAEPGMGRVAHGIPARVDKLRAIGNAIVPQVAAEFVKSVANITSSEKVR